MNEERLKALAKECGAITYTHRSSPHEAAVSFGPEGWAKFCAALAAQLGSVARDLTDEDMDAVIVAIAELNMGDIGYHAFCDRIIKLAAAPTEAKPEEPDCSGGIACTTCPDKRKCQRGCIRQGEALERPDQEPPQRHPLDVQALYELQKVMANFGGDWPEVPGEQEVVRRAKMLSRLLKADRKDLRAECDAVDALLRGLGLDPERCRTEGGALNVGRTLSFLKDGCAEAKPPTAPWGWKLVPVKMTDEMLCAPDYRRLVAASVGESERRYAARQRDWEAILLVAPKAPTEAKPAQDAVDEEQLPPMPENVLADIQQAHEYVSMWAKGEAYYAPVSAYDDMPGKRKATIKDVMKSAKFIAPRLMSASLAMRDYFAAIDVYTNKKGGV